MRIEIMDTTLRDGEQTPGVAFTDSEKFNLSRLLIDEVNVDRIEIASARISKGELESVKKIAQWCNEKGLIDRIEVLGFIDGDKSLNWISEAGAKVINLLCKGSLKHLNTQLRKTAEQHITDIKKIIYNAEKYGMKVNIYMEDWSNGMKESKDYVFKFITELKDENVKRFMLPDTLGVLNPNETFNFCKETVNRYPGVRFDFHAHNDYDLAVANSLMAVKAGVSGIHTTVNGLGERTGNTPLSSIVAVLNDHLDVDINVDEKKLNRISHLVEAFSGIRVPTNKPVIGEHVFTQCCGVHADGDKKGSLYFNRLVPKRFGRLRQYALGKTSGRASIAKNLEELGIELDRESIEKVTRRVVELGDKKENITKEDLPYIISDVLGSKLIKEKIKLKNYYICHAKDLNPVAAISIEIDNEIYNETSTGDGQYDAFMKALSAAYKKIDKKLPQLVDYVVVIPPGGNTNALVETTISWIYNEREFKTRGLDSDQTASAIKATVKMLNLINGDKMF